MDTDRRVDTQHAKKKAHWLRSEIEKLEGIYKRFPSGMSSDYVETFGFNSALDTIITRYKEELLELENTNE